MQQQMMSQAATGGGAAGTSGAGTNGQATGASLSFPMMQGQMPGMPGVMPGAGGDQAAGQNQQQFMPMPGFAMPMMYPGVGVPQPQNNFGGNNRKNNDTS